MKKKKKTNSRKLTTAEIDKFKNLLLVKRREILGDVSKMEDETLRKQRSDLSNMPIHMADVGSDNFEMENTLGIVDSERKLLHRIDDALARIEDHTYGVCEGSKKPISKERLEAIPWARYSVKYANLFEKGIVSEEPFTEDLDEDEDEDEDED